MEKIHNKSQNERLRLGRVFNGLRGVISTLININNNNNKNLN